MNGESLAEILKERMARCLERKNRAVRGLEREITVVQSRLERARREVRMLEYRLTSMRERREEAEIQCFKEVLQLHEQISKTKAAK